MKMEADECLMSISNNSESHVLSSKVESSYLSQHRSNECSKILKGDIDQAFKKVENQTISSDSEDSEDCPNVEQQDEGLEESRAYARLKEFNKNNFCIADDREKNALRQIVLQLKEARGSANLIIKDKEKKKKHKPSMASEVTVKVGPKDSHRNKESLVLDEKSSFKSLRAEKLV